MRNRPAVGEASRPAIALDELEALLAPHLERALPGRGFGRLSTPFPRKSAADAAGLLLVHDRRERPAAVVHVSAAAGDLVRRELLALDAVRERLGPDLGAVLLRPLLYLERGGRTIVAYPYHPPLSDERWPWLAQRLRLGPSLLRWVRGVLRATADEVVPDEHERLFAAPLRWAAEDGLLSPPLRRAARRARALLDDGRLRPRTALAHNDLWKGNLLLAAPETARPPFVVIDWRGAELRGYPFYDLLRLDESLRLPRWTLRRELLAHCRLLSCPPDGAELYLLACLGHLGRTLGCFAVERYRALADRLHERLSGALTGSEAS